MKLTVKLPTEIEVDAIKCVLPVRYEEEDIPNDFPGRSGDMLTLTLDLATAKVRDWPAGDMDCGMKVVDTGSYYLLNGETVVAKLEGDYVPSCIPQRYGDYVDFKIEEGGALRGWKPDALKVRRSFFPDSDDE